MTSVKSLLPLYRCIWTGVPIVGTQCYATLSGNIGHCWNTFNRYGNLSMQKWPKAQQCHRVTLVQQLSMWREVNNTITVSVFSTWYTFQSWFLRHTPNVFQKKFKVFMIPIFCVACQCLFTASPPRNLICFTVIFMWSSGCTQLVWTKLKQIQSLLLKLIWSWDTWSKTTMRLFYPFPAHPG